MDKKEKIGLLFFGIALVLFAIFTKKMHFHDALEYINLAKNLGGVENINIFSCHSALYPYLISFFLKILPSAATIRLINVFWIFLIGATLLGWLKNKIAFWLFVFSPLSWYISIQTTPILPASFFFLLSFIFLLKKDIKYNLYFSGIFLGLSFAFYSPVLLFSVFLILIYFWEKPLLETIKYIFSFFIGFSPILILDYFLFGNPLYSQIRFWGVNFIMSLNLHPSYSGVNNSIWSIFIMLLMVLFFISPVLFKIYKIDFKKYWKVLSLIIIISLIFIFRVPMIKYFILISPLIFILLSKILNESEIKWHCIISVILIASSIFFTHPVFEEGFLINGFFQGENSLINDLQKIQEEYTQENIIAGPLEAPLLASLSWKNKPYFVYYEDWEASIKNETLFRSYVFGFNSKKMPLKDKFEIIGSFSRYEDKTYKEYIFVSDKNNPIPEKSPDKCYKELCVYED